jgi:hypothetical protein
MRLKRFEKSPGLAGALRDTIQKISEEVAR